MKNIFSLTSTIVFTGIIFHLATSCTGGGGNRSSANDKIRQKDDGSIVLELNKASCYNDKADPSSNTAEWYFIVAKPGRYSVWLSSATTDTMHLEYKNSVKINLLDERLERNPVGDKIILNSTDVKSPYYRADSYMGSFYFQDPGEYSIQLISEKVIPHSASNEIPMSDQTRLMSVILMPMKR
jgi:hypothetical protein